MPQPVLRTARLLLVPLADRHLDLEIQLDSDPEVLRYLGGRARSAAEVAESHARRMALTGRVDGLGFWMAFASGGGTRSSAPPASEEEGEFAGLMMLPPAHGPDQPDDPAVSDLGYRLVRRYWRQGLASEASRALLRHAFATVGQNRVIAQTMSLNTASRHVLQDRDAARAPGGAEMPGDRWQQFANLRALLAWMWAHPGRPLLFMGGEMAQNDEWNHDRSVDWHMAGYPEHAGMQALVRALNTVYRAEPALWEQDFDWGGFRWIDPDDSDNSVLSFLRFPASAGRPVACLANLTPVPRPDYRIGLPHPGRWTEILNSDRAEFGGSNMLVGAVTAEAPGWNDLDYSATLTMPPLGVVWLAHEPDRG